MEAVNTAPWQGCAHVGYSISTAILPQVITVRYDQHGNAQIPPVLLIARPTKPVAQCRGPHRPSSMARHKMTDSMADERTLEIYTRQA